MIYYTITCRELAMIIRRDEGTDKATVASIFDHYCQREGKSRDLTQDAIRAAIDCGCIDLVGSMVFLNCNVDCNDRDCDHRLVCVPAL